MHVKYNPDSMITNKLNLVLVLSLFFAVSSFANNVKIVGDIKVVPSEITNNIAPFKFTVEWENSWRDEFNYDAVYVFLKYKLDGADDAWHHLYLGDEVTLTGTSGDKYSYSAINSTGIANKNEGLMIWRESAGFGKASVELSVKWDITKGGRVLNYTNFNDGKVFMSAMAIEMVYVPQGAYRLGDSRTGKTFRHKFLTIPAEKDIVSDEYRILTKENKVDPLYPPQYAANKLNDNDRTKTTNAWLGDGSADQIWTIDFGNKNGRETGEKKAVRYIAIESIPGYVPVKWRLYGMDEQGSTNKKLLLDLGGDSTWVTKAPNVYPTNKAIRIKEELVREYRYYSLEFTDMSGVVKGPAIKNVSMCTEDLGSGSNNTVVITNPVTKMTDQCGYSIDYIYTDESDMWSGVTGAVYPNGYNAFFAMKYEISQEQYVSFLNKLSLSQQTTRTIGEKLVPLKEGQYVFGDSPTTPTARNGIIVASRSGLTDPLVFANNLNKNDGEYAQDGDGQTLACNFLTPADMLAYADWTGLRPLSEMEYEKMSRRPFPAIPVKGEYAWNNTIATQPTGLTPGYEGKKSETVQNGNANFGNVAAIGGPVRCGAFAKGASSQEASGASFWGIMDLSGNLAELYYNVNAFGRNFSGLPRGSHGDGTLDLKTGKCNIGTGIWPSTENAFALRGGSYKSAASELETSNRTNNTGNYPAGNIDVRRADVSFRLGCTMTETTISTSMTMQNGEQTTATTDAADTICSGDDYLIKGDIPSGIKGAYTIAWYASGDGGDNWNLIENENGKDLRLYNLRNINVGDNIFKEYRYMRHIYSSGADAKSKQVIIRVVNHAITLTPDTMSVSLTSASDVIVFKTNLPSSVTWQFRDMLPQDFTKEVTPGKYFTHTPSYADFFYKGAQISGTLPLVISYKFYDKYCASTDTVWVKVPESGAPELDPSKVICGQRFADPRDGTVYNTIKIGTQCWMAENMNYASEGSICYDSTASNCGVYGRLYNWNVAVQTKTENVAANIVGVCPDGWRVPSTSDWSNMYSAAGGKAQNIKSPLGGLWPGDGMDASQLNTSGFSALPSGVCTDNNNLSYFVQNGVGSREAKATAYWWASNCTGNTNWGKNNGNGWIYDYMPYYATLNAAGTWSAADWSGLFYSSQNYAGYYSYGNTTDIFRSKFFLAVRCRRITAIQPGE